MRFSRRPLIGVVTVAAVVAGCTSSRAPAGQAYSAADSMAVQASTEKWRTSMVARDFDGWATSVSPDAVLYPPNAKPVVGRAAAVEYVKNYPVITKFDVVVQEQMGWGDVAYDRGTYMLSLTLPDGTAASDTGSFMSVFRRQDDGTWAHHRVMWNSSLPVASPPSPPARR